MFFAAKKNHKEWWWCPSFLKSRRRLLPPAPRFKSEEGIMRSIGKILDRERSTQNTSSSLFFARKTTRFVSSSLREVDAVARERERERRERDDNGGVGTTTTTTTTTTPRL